NRNGSTPESSFPFRKVRSSWDFQAHDIAGSIIESVGIEEPLFMVSMFIFRLRKDALIETTASIEPGIKFNSDDDDPLYTL
nr:hypothetical protein [Tanacetum cinerariifolium]